MNKKYVFKEVINGRWAIWSKDIKDKGKVKVFRIIDLYSTNRETRFVFAYKNMDEAKIQTSLSNKIRNFYRNNKNTFFVKQN
jgi:hypothetical protein